MWINISVNYMKTSLIIMLRYLYISHKYSQWYLNWTKFVPSRSIFTLHNISVSHIEYCLGQLHSMNFNQHYTYCFNITPMYQYSNYQLCQTCSVIFLLSIFRLWLSMEFLLWSNSRRLRTILFYQRVMSIVISL